MPVAVSKAAFERQRRNIGVTEMIEMTDRGHALTVDHGWRDVQRRRTRSFAASCSRGVLTRPRPIPGYWLAAAAARFSMQTATRSDDW